VLLLIAIKILLAVVEAVDSLFLVSPLLKLIGAGYTAWFIYRFLTRRETRQELTEQIDKAREQIKGNLTKQPVQTEPPISTTVVQMRPVDVQQPVKPPLEQPLQPPTQASGQQIAGVVGTVQVSIPLAGVVDVDALSAKLKKDLGKIEAEIQALSQRLSNSKFVDKAPADVVQNARTALAEAEKQAEILRERLRQLQN
jgi:valyl-tRNA synthetase